jgi:hypothetical protein
MLNPLLDAWGDFLGQYHWAWFVTLTFAGDVKTFTAHNRCNAWLRSLERAAGHPIFWFRGDEFGSRFGKFHMHLLIGNVAHLHRFTWMERWAVRNGWARVFEYNPALGARYYVAEYVNKQFGEWELSDNLDAFKIQQSVLPLVGQDGSPISEKRERQRVVKEFENQVDPVQPKQAGDLTRHAHIANLGTNQLSLADYTEPDLSEVDFDPIRADFQLQTKRKKR